MKLLIKKKEQGQLMPNLILLDINMPVMDGFEFLQKYNLLEADSKRDTIVVMLTTSTHMNDMDKLISNGNIDLVNKPLTQEKLLQLMNKYFWNTISQSA